jgi:hypothetical protein
MLLMMHFSLDVMNWVAMSIQRHMVATSRWNVSHLPRAASRSKMVKLLLHPNMRGTMGVLWQFHPRSLATIMDAPVPHATSG